ncbi:PilZ domain-containing protein [Qipengyuania sp.]|uniref:PilZ domain-containing protein n=1 Tax=Qipengyuania sp. TaxID=2004515 RepID=UPI0035C834E9
MASYLSRTAHAADRRAYQRLTVDCHAQLVLPSGERAGRISDLSESGARFETEKPPLAGTSARLLWGDQDRPCRVMWSSDGRCGLHFDRPIDNTIVARTASGEQGAQGRFGRVIGQSSSLRALRPGIRPTRG